MTTMSEAAHSDHAASIRAAASALNKLAAEHGLSRLRVADRGDIVADVSHDRDLIDVYEFEIAAQEQLGLDVHVVSSGALSNEGIDESLVHATEL